MIDVNIFILVQIIVGMCWSWHKSFIAVFVYSEIHASKTILGSILISNKYFIYDSTHFINLGFAISISGIGTLIMYWFAKIIVNRLGAVHSVILSLFVTALRFVAYFFTTYDHDPRRRLKTFFNFLIEIILRI